MFSDIRQICEWQVFDPNDEDNLYICSNHGNVFKCNIRTRDWSKMPHMGNATGSFLFPLITWSWWPTPVPRLPQHCHLTPSPPQAFNLRACCKVHSIIAADKDEAKVPSDV